MTIDVHAHYVPQSLIAAARQRGTDMGVRVIDGAATRRSNFPTDSRCGRSFQLVETAEQRTAWLDFERIDRQLVATWPDIYAYGCRASNASRGMSCSTTRSPAGATTMPATSRLSLQYPCRAQKMPQPGPRALRAWAQWR